MLSVPVESSGSSLRVEPLRAAHLHGLQTEGLGDDLPRFQRLLLRSLVARLDGLWPGEPITRQPRVLVALEQGILRALVQVRPYNRQWSCWLLSLEELSPGQWVGRRQLLKALLQQALLGTDVRSRSWVIRCDSSCDEQLDVLRELGFQPLKTQRIWRPGNADASQPAALPHTPTPLPTTCQWSPLNRRTAPLLWPLEQAASSSHLRQIIDRRYPDLLDQSGRHTGVLLWDSGEASVAIAGLVRQELADGSFGIELLRDVAWDERLSQALPALLDQLLTQRPAVVLVTDQADSPLSQLLTTGGWHPLREELLLGRSLWRQHGRSRAVPLTHPLDTMLGRLQPQHPPLPTPSLGRR
ncbi:hypothetical protein SynRCC2555_01608 [Synechococcus sp. WH 8101]|nr:hypothetical protein SynRCC2555_01608 [Synechococcus sp. WH 8101]